MHLHLSVRQSHQELSSKYPEHYSSPLEVTLPFDFAVFLHLCFHLELQDILCLLYILCFTVPRICPLSFLSFAFRLSSPLTCIARYPFPSLSILSGLLSPSLNHVQYNNHSLAAYCIVNIVHVSAD